MDYIKLNKAICKKCGYTWFKRAKQPKRCPQCCSWYWDGERKWKKDNAKRYEELQKQIEDDRFELIRQEAEKIVEKKLKEIGVTGAKPGQTLGGSNGINTNK